MERAMRIKFMGYLARGYGLEEIMNKILDKQIDMGMLPPLYKINITPGATYKNWKDIQEWESEDD